MRAAVRAKLSGNRESSMRTVADVSYNASINGGELVVFDGQLGNFGGTSVGPPHWSAIFALADQARETIGESALGAANSALYSIAGNKREYGNDFHDITVGSNAVNSDIGYQAGPKPQIPRHANGRFNGVVCADAGDDKRIDSRAAHSALQVGSDEGTIRPLRNDSLTRLGEDFRFELVALLTRPIC